jgi:DeoR family fructose operon transcriptional repressor
MSEKRKERISSIYSYVKNNGYASIPELMEVFDASRSTIKRDLDIMAEMKMAERVHGGIAINPSLDLPLYSARENISKDAKIRIAKAAAELVKDDDTIMILSGTTCFAFFNEIKAKNVTVFTLNVASLRYTNTNVSKLYVLEGEVYPDRGIIGGSLSIENLTRISPEKIFFSVSAINENFELQCRTDDERAMIVAITKTNALKVLMVDKTKTLERRSFNASSLEKIDVCITDAEIDQAMIDSIEKKGTKLIFV